MQIRQDNTAVLLIDIQEKLLPAIYEGKETLAKSVAFVNGLRLLDIPIVAICHYPKGLGDLVPELKTALDRVKPFEKNTFSACGNDDIKKHISGLGKENILVFGMEAHICVLQTVLDLVHESYNTAVVCDCVASRSIYDKEIALRRAEKEGAFLTTSEAVLFELLQKSGTEKFKAVSALIK